MNRQAGGGGRWLCAGCFLALAGLGVWTWLELQSWLARSDVLTPFMSLGLRRFLNGILFTSGALLLFFLLCLYAIYRTCREDSRRVDAAGTTPAHPGSLQGEPSHDWVHLRGAWTR